MHVECKQTKRALHVDGAREHETRERTSLVFSMRPFDHLGGVTLEVDL
jgi:hypothetical protein